MGAADRRRRRRQLVDARAHLRPGIYRQVAERTWLRFGSRAPAGLHVRRTLGTILRTQRSAIRPLGRAVARRMAHVVGSAFVVLPGRPGPGCSVLVVSYDGGYVLLDRSRSTVVRHLPGRIVSPGEERLRREWSESVSSPAFRVGPDRSVVCEELVPGETAARAPLPEQITHVRAVFAMCAELARRHGRSRPDLLGPAPDVGPAADAPGDADVFGPYRGDQATLREAHVEWVVPAMPDPTPWNLLVGDAGPVFVDVHPVVLRPYFFVPITLVGSWMLPSPELRLLYSQGHLDDALADLLRAAGSHAPITDRLRTSLLVWSLHSWVWLLEWMRAGYRPPDPPTVESRLDDVLRERGLDAALDCP